jgi:LEA14-like dessication related protein
LLATSGCSLWRLQPPAVTLANLQVIEATFFEQRFAVKLRVQNPNDLEIPIRGVSFELLLNGQPFARGVSDQAATLPRLGETVLEITAVSDLTGLLRQLHEWRKGDRPSLSYELKGRLVTDLVKDLTFAHRGTLDPPQSSGDKH